LPCKAANNNGGVKLKLQLSTGLCLNEADEAPALWCRLGSVASGWSHTDKYSHL